MISKIIQKEKERQEEYLEEKRLRWGSIEEHFNFCSKCEPDSYCPSYRIKHHLAMKVESKIESHKQSLINLKEYIEEEVNSIMGFISNQDIFYEKSRNASNDIDELTKMIKRYA